MKLNEAIAKRLSALLEAKNMTSYELAKRGGISKQIVYAVVNNEYKKVSTDTVYQIAATLNMGLDEFFADPIFKEITD